MLQLILRPCEIYPCQRVGMEDVYALKLSMNGHSLSSLV